MSATAEYYLSIICNAGLDSDDEQSWDRLENVLRKMPKDADHEQSVDVFDYAVDELMREDGWYADESTISAWDTLKATYWAGILGVVAFVFLYVAVKL